LAGSQYFSRYRCEIETFLRPELFELDGRKSQWVRASELAPLNISTTVVCPRQIRLPVIQNVQYWQLFSGCHNAQIPGELCSPVVFFFQQSNELHNSVDH